MAHVDFKNRSITAKVVYYGCGLCGKTTNLEYVNSHSKNASELMAVATEGDRTIFFDFLPMSLGKIRGIDTQFKLYAVPGQVRYNMTRKLVLKDVDGVVFVVDSQKPMLQANRDSLENLYENLRQQGVDPDSIPIVLQYNKQDLGNAFSAAELDKRLNGKRYATFLASAKKGDGVFETLDHVCRAVFDSLYGSLMGGEASAPPTAPLPERRPAAVELNGLERAPAEAPREAPAPAEVEPAPAPVAASPSAAPPRPTEAASEGRAALETLTAAVERIERLVLDVRADLAAAKEAWRVPRSEPRDAAAASASGVAEKLRAVETALAREKQASQQLRADAERERAQLERSRAADIEAVKRDLQQRTDELRSVKMTSRDRDLRILELERQLRERVQSASPTVVPQAAPPSPVPAEPAIASPAPAALPAASPAPQAEAATPLATSPAAPLEAVASSAAGSAAATEPPPSPPAPAAPAAAAPAVAQADALAAQPEHQNAQRVARVMVGDVLLYHRDLIAEALRSNDAQKVLAEPLAEARKTYESRVPEAVRSQRDYLTLELERMLAEQRGAPASPETATAPKSQPAAQTDAAAAAPAAASEPVGQATEGRGETEQADPFAEDQEHKTARRIARVMVADLILYHRDQVSEGIRNGNVKDALSEPIAEARKTYESRVPEAVRKQRDYLMLEIDRMIEKQSQSMRAG